MSQADRDALLAAARPLIELALAEDIGPGDATSMLLPPDQLAQARMVARAEGVVAGLPVVEAVLACVDPGLRLIPRVEDGARIRPGDVLAEIEGPARGLLSAERTALNFVQRLSGIATLTRAFVGAVAGTRAVILDTRKTHPGYRVLEKYAVRMGGGQNHRMGLYDMLLIKDNHVDAAGSITAAVTSARAARPDLPIEVEVRHLDELQEALALDVDRIMLDNMDLDRMRIAVEITAGQTPLEASGGVDLARVTAIAATGVDYISVGALTHSAPALDISVQISRLADSRLQIAGANLESTTSNLQSANLQSANLQSANLPICILGHHYQRDEVIEWADLRGDSLELARAAASSDARYIVFCGVHFMAETAAILARPGQTVLLPDLDAGCALADMADLEQAEAAWNELGQVLDVEREVLPVTYVNSTARLKAFCGEHGGAVCTSSNAQAVLEWALAQRKRVFFFPDQHLGRNTARRMGIPLEEMALWDPYQPLGGNDGADLARARVILWDGYCCVHQRFLPAHVDWWRERLAGVRVIVHPECPFEVVERADEAGSTAHIIRRVQQSPPGSRWAIGTEFNLVNRLRQQHPEQIIVSLSTRPSYCATMNQITPARLARVLEGLAAGELIHPVTVPEDVARPARLALERMLELGR